MSGLDGGGVVDGIESTMSSIAFHRAALSGLCEVLSSGYVWQASFSATDEKVIPSENLHPAVVCTMYQKWSYGNSKFKLENASIVTNISFFKPIGDNWTV